jgi:hypothetical protein
MNHWFHRLLVLTLVFLLLVTSSVQAQRIVTLITIYGENAWNPGCILGGSPIWRLVPHTTEPKVFTDLIMGFDEPENLEMDEVPQLPGHGSVVELAMNEGWDTAFFAATDTMLDTVFQPLHDQFASWTEVSPGYRNWDRLNDLHGIWLATHGSKRFSWIHLSLADLPSGGGGSTELYRFWVQLEETLEALSDEWALFAVFLPMEFDLPWISSQTPLVSFRGEVDIPRESIVLSTLDITPSLAHTMRFLNTPDYRGQSLALWKKIGKRVEPLPIEIHSETGFQGTRIIAFTEPPVDGQMLNQIRLYDLWSESFTSCFDEARECSRLSGLLAATEKFDKQMEGFITTVDSPVEENGEE